MSSVFSSLSRVRDVILAMKYEAKALAIDHPSGKQLSRLFRGSLASVYTKFYA